VAAYQAAFHRATRRGPVRLSLPRLLSRYRYLGMAIGLDGQVYANDFGPLSPGNLYIVSPVTGQQISTVLTGIYGAGMALDPLTGDLYVSRCGPTACPGPDIRKISGLYGAPGGPRISTFVTVTGAEFDGLAPCSARHPRNTVFVGNSCADYGSSLESPIRRPQKGESWTTISI